jgi:hypothetical protein
LWLLGAEGLLDNRESISLETSIYISNKKELTDMNSFGCTFNVCW